MAYLKLSSHGPCLSDKDNMDCDSVFIVNIYPSIRRHGFTLSTAFAPYFLLLTRLQKMVVCQYLLDQGLCQILMYYGDYLFLWPEEEDIDIFKLPKFVYCFTLCIHKLILWVINCFCPKYFIICFKERSRITIKY